MKKRGVVLLFVFLITFAFVISVTSLSINFASATIIEANYDSSSVTKSQPSSLESTIHTELYSLTFSNNIQSYIGQEKKVDSSTYDNGETGTMTLDHTFFDDGTNSFQESFVSSPSGYHYTYHYEHLQGKYSYLMPSTWASSLNEYKQCVSNPSSCSGSSYTYSAVCSGNKLVVEGTKNTAQYFNGYSYITSFEHIKLAYSSDSDEYKAACQFTLSDPKVYLDPEYIQKTNQTRHFIPTQITPFDDIICEVKVKDPSANSITNSLNLKAQLLTRDSSGNWNVVLKESQPSEWIGMSPLDSQGNSLDYQIYQWKIKGWSEPSPVGWTSDNDKMEELISAGKVKCVVSDASNPANTVSTMPVITSNCVHVWGKDDARVKVAFMRGQSAELSPKTLVRGSLDIKEGGINSISPLKEYNSSFSEYVDLKNHDDSGWAIRRDNDDYVFFTQQVMDNISEISSCDKRSKYVFFNTRTYRGYTQYFSKAIFMSDFFNSNTFIHELGHALIGLADEYCMSGAPCARNGIVNSFFSFVLRLLGRTINSKNCMTNPDWGSYGNSFIPCLLDAHAKRPSANSVMRYPSTQFLNVVSCGYYLKYLEGNTIEQSSLEPYWNACMNPSWNTLKPYEECLSVFDCYTSRPDLFGSNLDCLSCTNRRCGIKINNNCRISSTSFGKCNSQGSCIQDPNLECVVTEDCVLNYGTDFTCSSCSSEGRCQTRNEGVICDTLVIPNRKCVEGACV